MNKKVDLTDTTGVDHLVSPAYYTDLIPEPIDVIEGWKLGYNLGCVIKYLARAGRKTDKRLDLYKAIWYIERELLCEGRKIFEVKE
jgi:hypothetical protein